MKQEILKAIEEATNDSYVDVEKACEIVGIKIIKTKYSTERRSDFCVTYYDEEESIELNTFHDYSRQRFWLACCLVAHDKGELHSIYSDIFTRQLDIVNWHLNKDKQALNKVLDERAEIRTKAERILAPYELVAKHIKGMNTRLPNCTQDLINYIANKLIIPPAVLASRLKLYL